MSPSQIRGGRRGASSPWVLLALFLVATVAAGSGASAAEQVLDAGAVHVVPASAATCFSDVDIADPGPTDRTDPDNMHATASCDGGRLRVFLASGFSILSDAVDVSARSRLVTQFRVPEVPGAKEPSFVPVTVTLPVSWFGRLFNDNVIPGGFFAWANANLYARLREGDASDASIQGRVLEEVRFNGASHGGISGCLDIPTSEVSVATTIVKCSIAAFDRDSGSQSVSLSGVAQTGKTYNVEIVLAGAIHTLDAHENLPATPPDGAHPQLDFTNPPLTGGDAGVEPGDLTISLGTDFQKNLQDLQDQIDQLRSDFEHHTHEYLTGRGIGQNNTVVDTGPPVVDSSAGPPQPPFVPGQSKPNVGSASLARTRGFGGTVILDVVGSGFVSGSRVRWNGVERSTTFIGPTHLRATLSRRDVARPGSYAVTVSNPPPGAGVSNPYYLSVK